MSEYATGEQPAVVRPPANMRRAVLWAALAFVLLTLACYAVFGTFWDKKGIFWGGIHSQQEYQQALASYQGEQMDPVRQVHRVTLGADGKATLQYEMQYALRAGRRAVAYNTWSGKRSVRITYRDARGRVIPTRVTRYDQNSEVYLLLLPPELHKGDRVLSGGTTDASFLLRREGEGWLFEYRHMHGDPIHYTQELTLPAGARLTQAQPPPVRTKQAGGRLTLVYDRRLGSKEFFRCRVRYRIGPTGAGAN